jgi:hypothetical protein
MSPVHVPQSSTSGSGLEILNPAQRALSHDASTLSTPRSPTPANGSIVTVLSISGGTLLQKWFGANYWCRLLKWVSIKNQFLVLTAYVVHYYK